MGEETFVVASQQYSLEKRRSEPLATGGVGNPDLSEIEVRFLGMKFVHGSEVGPGGFENLGVGVTHEDLAQWGGVWFDAGR